MRSQTLIFVLATSSLNCALHAADPDRFEAITLFRPVERAGETCFLANSGLIGAAGVVPEGNNSFVSRIFLGGEKGFEMLPGLPGYSTFIPFAMNQKGDFVGTSLKFAAPPNPSLATGTIWLNGSPQALPTPDPLVPGNPMEFIPLAINNSGAVAGQTIEAGSNQSVKTVLLRNGQFETLPPPADGQLFYVPVAMNNKGDIAIVYFRNGQYFNAIYTGNGYTPLNTPPNVRITGLNERGDVVGSYLDNSAIFVMQSGQARTLPKPLGSDIVTTHSINNQGVACVRLQRWNQQNQAEGYFALIDLSPGK